jgi:hypothetical protein
MQDPEVTIFRFSPQRTFTRLREMDTAAVACADAATPAVDVRDPLAVPLDAKVVVGVLLKRPNGEPVEGFSKVTMPILHNTTDT